jgi:hypothetical protein
MSFIHTAHTSRSLSYRPWRVRVNEVSMALFWTVTPGVIASIGLGLPWGYLTAAVAATVGFLVGETSVPDRIARHRDDGAS